MKNHELAQNLLTEFFQAAGYRKNSRFWYKKLNDAFIVFEYHRSWNGPFFMVNFGLYFNAVNPLLKGFPTVLDCHIRGQDTAFIGKIREPKPSAEDLRLITDMCGVDLEDNVIKRNIDSLTTIFRQEVIPYLEKHTDIIYLASIYPEQYNWNALPDVRGIVKRLTEEYKIKIKLS